jgi:hypothetical protein
MERAWNIEQVNFDADDSRCNEQKIDSFASLVSYDTEFSNPSTEKNNSSK